MSRPPAVMGWDIGGVNTKAARLNSNAPPDCRSTSLPYELQRQPSLLSDTLRTAAWQIGAERDDCHAVTMTAELSQFFRTKREGVGFVLDALEATFPSERLHVYTVSGRFVSPEAAREDPLGVAASNWAATASWVGRWIPNCILIDVGSTTSDLIPIRQGRIAAWGRTDPERLRTGELVYTGALRTPVEAIARRLRFRDATIALAAEGFALSGDVHLWLGGIRPEEYTCPTPDGRPAIREYAGERLARSVCADRDLLDDADIDQLATGLAFEQTRNLCEALRAIRERCPELDTAVVTGLGEFIAAGAARLVGLKVCPLAEKLHGSSQTAPATAVAYLLRTHLSRSP
ncbi:MAG TPA: hydantoinase/oxoprolinase family protein [Gemmatimonadales bacterium]|nr:hydantoinase/oxoprolinase family protein [Gemmatimonadales bacterium]